MAVVGSMNDPVAAYTTEYNHATLIQGPHATLDCCTIDVVVTLPSPPRRIMAI